MQCVRTLQKRRIDLSGEYTLNREMDIFLINSIICCTSKVADVAQIWHLGLIYN